MAPFRLSFIVAVSSFGNRGSQLSVPRARPRGAPLIWSTRLSRELGAAQTARRGELSAPALAGCAGGRRSNLSADRLWG